MHAMSLLDKWLQRNAVIGHRARDQALVRVVGALLSAGKLALTHLGVTARGAPLSNTTSRPWTDCWAIVTCIVNETAASMARWRGRCWEASHVR